MKRVNIFLILVSVLFMVSCTSNSIQDISAVVTNPTYAADVGPVFAAQCVGCHGGGQSPALNNYDNVKAACKTGNVLCRIEESCGGIMPQSGKMPQATIDMIKLWAAQDYKQ